MCPLYVRLMLMLHSIIFVTALVIKYVQLPACPTTLIYSWAISVSRKCVGEDALSLIESLLV